MKNFFKQKAFTFIELIVVVSVIAVLMTIIVPSAQKVLINSRKSKAQNYMKQIAEGYARYYNEKGYIPQKSSGQDLAHEFAKNGELNNANIYIFPGDAKAADVAYETIYPQDGGNWPWEKNAGGYGEFSVYLVSGITEDVNVSTTPVAFSRGLTAAGSWKSDGAFGIDGGFVSFLDGQVRWYKNLADDGGKLSTYNGSTSTANLTAALPTGINVLARESTASL